MAEKTLYIKTPLLEMLYEVPAGARVRFKMEAYQPCGSFKLRGMECICRDAAAAGSRAFMTTSGGNAGLAMTYVARQLGYPATVVVPESTSAATIDKLRRCGAEVKAHGESYAEAHAYALSIKDEATTYVPSFDHPKLWEGHSSMIDELKEQCPEKPDLIIASVGGGGLFCGIMEGLVRNGWEDVRVIAVETRGTASLFDSVKAGELVTLDKIDSIATSLGAKTVTPKALEYARDYNVTPFLVSDAEAALATVRFLDEYRTLVEPACGASLAVAFGHPELLAGRSNVVVVACGGVNSGLADIEAYKRKYAA